MTIIGIFLSFCLTDIHHMPAAPAGVLILIPRIWNIVTDLLMSALGPVPLALGGILLIIPNRRGAGTPCSTGQTGLSASELRT